MVGTVLHSAGEAVVSALRGADLVEVGPFFNQLSLADLRDVRPEAVDRVEWDPVVEIRPGSGVGNLVLLSHSRIKRQCPD